MRIAILTLTDAGFKLAEKISARMGGENFIKVRDFDSLKNFVAEIFNKFDACFLHTITAKTNERSIRIYFKNFTS